MSEDTMLDESIQKIVEAMTALAGLKSTLEARQLIITKHRQHYTGILNATEEGRTYSLSELSKTGKWGESEVTDEPPVRVIDVEPESVSHPLDMEDEDSLWASLK